MQLSRAASPSGAAHTKAGPIALVGSGEYLPQMEATDRILLDHVGGTAARVVVLATAAGLEPPASPARWTRMGIEHFNRGNFGIAERYFRDATEKAPKDPTAWTGLAASYDRLARFDLADRAYVYAIRLVGETTEILNNQGYSYMLRGDLVKARAKFLKAYEREPNNPTILNNLQLLNSSSRFVQRSPAQ